MRNQIWLLVGFVLLSAMPVFGETTHVGGYEFPPFVERKGKQYYGLTIDLLHTLNASQDRYLFRFVPTSPKRRYNHFEKGKYDLIFFESIQWGWKDKPVQASRVFLEGGEVYITASSKKQEFFENISDKSIAAFLGYHYGFAGFNANEDYLKQHFQIKLTTSHDQNIWMAVKKKVDIAVVTKAYLNNFLMKNPEVKEKIMISDKMDQIYKHTVLVRKGSKPDITEMNRMLTELEKKGLLDALWKKYGIR